jgi:hypothetical protein
MALQSAVAALPITNTAYTIACASVGVRNPPLAGISSRDFTASKILTQIITLGSGEIGLSGASLGLNLALFDASGVELTTVNSPGYARLAVPLNLTNWSLGADGLTWTNLLVLNFAVATGAWVAALRCGYEITSIGGATNSNGSIVGSAALTAAVSVLSTNQLSFSVGNLTLTQSSYYK